MFLQIYFIIGLCQEVEWEEGFTADAQFDVIVLGNECWGCAVCPAVSETNTWDRSCWSEASPSIWC